jgi:hypothetical protein
MKQFFFLECWNGEPYKRPIMNKVVDRLKNIIKIISIEYSNQLSKHIEKIINFIDMSLVKGNVLENKMIVEYCNHSKFNLSEIILLSEIRNNDNDNDPNSIFLLGVFYQLGIGKNVDEQMAINLYKAAVELGHSTAQCCLTNMQKNKDEIKLVVEGEYINIIKF